MKQPSTVPEYSVEESGKIRHMGSKLDSFVQELLDLEVDSVVLYKELTRLEGISGRIRDSLRELRQSLVEQE